MPNTGLPVYGKAGGMPGGIEYPVYGTLPGGVPLPIWDGLREFTLDTDTDVILPEGYYVGRSFYRTGAIPADTVSESYALSLSALQSGDWKWMLKTTSDCSTMWNDYIGGKVRVTLRAQAFALYTAPYKGEKLMRLGLRTQRPPSPTAPYMRLAISAGPGDFVQADAYPPSTGWWTPTYPTMYGYVAITNEVVGNYVMVDVVHPTTRVKEGIVMNDWLYVCARLSDYTPPATKGEIISRKISWEENVLVSVT